MTGAPHIGLLGGFRLTVDARQLAVQPAAQRVVAYLALHDRGVTRDHLAGALWPDLRPSRASANLRAAIWRAVLPDVTVLVGSRTHVRLDDAVVVDYEAAVDRARRLIWSAADVPDDVPRDLAGDLLPGWEQDWVLTERERIRQLRLHALDALCDRLAATGRGGEAVTVGRAVVAEAPLRESAQRSLIRAYLAQGDAVAARRQYEAYRATLADALGVPPGPLARALVRDLLPA